MLIIPGIRPTGLPAGLPRVVTYAAKWESGSAYYAGTVPRLLDASDGDLGQRLDRLARRVWAAVDGSGCGRIDVRMDGQGRLFVLDVNPNPDLSVDAGLARQAAAAGWSYIDLIAHIVEAAFAQHRRQRVVAAAHDADAQGRRDLHVDLVHRQADAVAAEADVQHVDADLAFGRRLHRHFDGVAAHPAQRDVGGRRADDVSRRRADLDVVLDREHRVARHADDELQLPARRRQQQHPRHD